MQHLRAHPLDLGAGAAESHRQRGAPPQVGHAQAAQSNGFNVDVGIQPKQVVKAVAVVAHDRSNIHGNSGGGLHRHDRVAIGVDPRVQAASMLVEQIRRPKQAGPPQRQRLTK